MSRKLYHAALSILIAAAAAGVTPVRALEGGTVYTPINGGNAVFEKYLLLMTGNTQVPNMERTMRGQAS